MRSIKVLLFVVQHVSNCLYLWSLVNRLYRERLFKLLNQLTLKSPINKVNCDDWDISKSDNVWENCPNTPISRTAILDRVPHQNEAGRACGHLEGCFTWSLSGNNSQIWLTIIAV